MAHNLATINGSVAMAYLDETPWHGLGQKLDVRGLAADAMIDAALDAARMRYQVASLPIFLADGSQVHGYGASVRLADDGTVAATLSVVGDGYHHIQNTEAVAILRPLAEEFGCVPAAAGVLGDGERCWMLMRLADATVTPVPGDDVRGYFLLHWGHDGQMSVQALCTGVRVVCQNTLGMATNGRKAWISIRHTAGAGARIDDAAKLVRTLMGQLQATGETFADMARKAIAPDAIVSYIDRVIPNTDASKANVSPVIMARRETVARLVFAGRGAALANQLIDTSDGTASLWAVYNAVTEYVDHVRPAEAASVAGRLNAQTSAVFGGNAEIKAQALNVARELVLA